MYKMFVFDIDGTLVQHLTNSLSKEIKDMFKRLKEKGYIVTLATGRDFVSIGDIHKNENIDYFIGANGSFIYDLKNNKYIFNSPINFDEYKEYQDKVLFKNSKDVKTVILSDLESVYVWEKEEKKGPWFWSAFKEKFRELDDAVDSLIKSDFHLVTIECANQSNLCKITSEYFEQKKSNMHVQASWSTGFFIANKGITKAHSINMLCDYLSIEMREVMAFGDSGNDKEMIEQVGWGVAMGNATAEIKEIANDITIDVDQFGTLKYLEKKGII